MKIESVPMLDRSLRAHSVLMTTLSMHQLKYEKGSEIWEVYQDDINNCKEMIIACEEEIKKTKQDAKNR